MRITPYICDMRFMVYHPSAVEPRHFYESLGRGTSTFLWFLGDVLFRATSAKDLLCRALGLLGTWNIFRGYTHKVPKCIQQGWNSRWPTAKNNLGKLGDSPSHISAFVGSFPCFKPRAGLGVLVLKIVCPASILENLHYPPMLEIWTSSLPCDGCKKKSIQAFSVFRAVFCWKQHTCLINGSF